MSATLRRFAALTAPLAPFALLTFLLIPAVWVYLFGDLPRTNDLASHLYRAYELSTLLRDGVFFPRWGPHLLTGYGYPVFNYFPYGAHYPVALLIALGLPALLAYRIIASLAILGSGWASYLLARDLFQNDPRAGLIAGLAFVYSPYLLYTSHVRGSLPESLALVWLPFTLWALLRLTHDDLRFLPMAALGFAAYLFSHVGVALQASGLLLVWGLWHSREQPTVAIPRVFTALALGVALTAFAWLPAIAELSAITPNPMASVGNDYRLNFNILADLFDYAPLPIDTALLNPPVRRPLPLLTLLLAIGTLVTLPAQPQPRRSDLRALALAALGCVFISLDLSRLIWDAVPLLQLTIWPWRFIGPATLALALIAASLPASQPSHPLYIAAFALLIVTAGLPETHAPRQPLPDRIAIPALARAEIPPFLIGSTTTGEYTPRWVGQLPDLDPTRQQLIADSDYDRLTLSAPATVQHTTNRLLLDRYTLVTDTPLTATYGVFYFPGWQVTLNGQPLPTTPSHPHGLLQFDIPPGQHTLTIRFDSLGTPVRFIATLFSLLTAATMVLVTVLVFRQPAAPQPPTPLPGRWLWLAALLILLTYPLLLTTDNPFFRNGLRTGQPVGMDHTLNTDLGGQLTLLGYTINADRLPAGSTLTVDLFWQAQQPLGVPYTFNLRLRDADGTLWNTLDTIRPRTWRFIPGTDFWPPDQIIRDSYLLTPLVGTPPGPYQLEVVAFRPDTLQELGVAPITAITFTQAGRTLPPNAALLAQPDPAADQRIATRYDRQTLARLTTAAPSVSTLTLATLTVQSSP